MMIGKKSEVLESTPFSKFIREASSREKKRVYTDVLKKATERQNRLMHTAASNKAKT